MMSKPDNHVDEILIKLHKSHYDTIDGADRCEKYINRAKQQLDQHYADFYRNKIPEKIADATNDKRVPYIGGFSEGYNQAIDDITAQFNSGGSDG